MAYINTLDERYGGTVWSSGAEDWDAPNTLNNSYVLAASSIAYGTGSDNYYTADIDVYSLGLLGAGTYVLDVDDFTWDWSRLDLGSISSFALHDVNGSVLQTSFSPYTDITFTVYTPSTYYLAVTGSTYGTAQYSAYYSKLANPNSVATFSNPTYDGALSVGSTVSVDITYSDLNGNSDNEFTVFWYTSDSESILASGSSFDYTLTTNEQGKTLQYQVGFIDDDGYVELSQVYNIGTIDGLAPSITSSTLFEITEDTSFSFTLTAVDPQGDSVSFSAPNLPDWLNLTDNGSGTATLTGTASEYEVWQNYWKDPDNYWSSPQQSIDITVSDGVNDKVVSHDFSIINVLNEPIPTPLYWPPLDNIYDLFMQGSAWLFPDGVSRTIDWALTDVIDSWGDSSDFVAAKVNEIVEATEKFIDIDFNYAGYFTSYAEANKAGVEINFSLDYGHIINSPGSYGIAGFPSLETISASSDDWFFDYFQAGDVYLNTNMFSGLENASTEVVTDFQFVALHEMGHALGLKHPHDSGGTGRPTFDDAGMEDFNDVLYTIMAYENTGVFATNSIAVPLTPMILDAITLQYLYGKKTTGESLGDTLYEPESGYGAYVLDYDVSGYDTFSAAKLGVAQEIYINEYIIDDTCVTYLNDTGDVPPLQQAVGVLGSIENVVCTSNDDLIFDYSDNASMTTKISSLSLDGGSGQDNLTLIKSFSDIELLSLSNATYTMQFSDITYQLTNIESLTDAASETKTIEQLYGEYKINEAPLVTSEITDSSAIEDSAYSYDVSSNFSDADGDTLVFTATLSNGDDLPSWLTMSPTGTLSGTPDNGDVGAIVVTATASDSSSASVSDTFSLTTSTANYTQVILNTKIQQDSVYTLDLSQVFESGHSSNLFVYSAELAPLNTPWAAVGNQLLPDWLTIDSETGLLQGTPSHANSNTIHKIDVAATSESDTSLSSAHSFYLLIENSNDAPVINGTYTATVSKNTDSNSVSGSISATDIDGSINKTLAFAQPFSSYVSSTDSDGVTVITQSNPFGDVATETLVDGVSTYTNQHRDGLTVTQTYSHDHSTSQTVETISSTAGDNYTITKHPVDGGIFVDTVTTMEGSVVFLGEVYKFNNFTSVYRNYPSDQSASGLVSATGSLVRGDTFYGSSLTEEGPSILVSRPSGGPSIVYKDYLTYTFVSQNGIYGTIDLDDNHSWVYTLDTTDIDTVGLASGMSATDTFTLSVSDGEATTSQIITVNIIGGFTSLEGSGDTTTPNQIIVNTTSELITGTSTADTITSLGGTNAITAKEGNDTVTLSSNSTWSSYFAQNVSNGESIGTKQTVELNGLNRFADVIDGGADRDTLFLTAGSDAFFLDDVYSSHHDSLTLTETSRGTDSTARMLNLEVINAGLGDDLIDLTSTDYALASGHMQLNGGEGNDTLWAAQGNDTLDGGEGNDVLFGGSGDDQLIGGAGADIFEFTITSGNDTITDYDISAGDVIRFYARRGEAEDGATATLSDGLITWQADAQHQVTIAVAGISDISVVTSDISDVSADIIIQYDVV